MKKTALILFVCLFALCGYSRDKKLVILHTNDTHSHIEALRIPEADGFGGVIERAAFIDSVRKADGRRNVLLLDAGDIGQGTSYFQMFNGDIEVDLVNAMKYDVMCLGNHEFDNGTDELARRLGNLKAKAVCANYDFSESSLAACVKPYVIVRRAGLKIGIIGLLEDLSSLVAKGNNAGIQYLDPAEQMNKYADFLKNDKKCDIVICLTHVGFTNGETSDLQLAAVSCNVDIFVGGHSHTFLDEPAYVKNTEGKDVLVVTDGCWGLNVGKIDVYDFD